MASMLVLLLAWWLLFLRALVSCRSWYWWALNFPVDHSILSTITFLWGIQNARSAMVGQHESFAWKFNQPSISPAGKFRLQALSQWSIQWIPGLLGLKVLLPGRRLVDISWCLPQLELTHIRGRLQRGSRKIWKWSWLAVDQTILTSYRIPLLYGLCGCIKDLEFPSCYICLAASILQS